MISAAYLATRRAQGAIGGDSDGVDVAGVASQGGAELAVAQAPHLHHLVPASRHDDWVVDDRGEAHSGNPLGVAVWFPDGVLALTQCVPQLDGLVSRARNDLRQTPIQTPPTGRDFCLKDKHFKSS